MRVFRKKLVRHRLTLLGILAWSLHAPVMAKTSAAKAPQTQGKATLSDAPPHARNAKKSFPQIGRASWYGVNATRGMLTASGEPLDPQKFTGAHPTLPFGTRVKITNLRNGRSTQVRINDRGPFGAGRIIDVSYAAAHALGMMARGVARVRIEVLPAEKKQPAVAHAEVIAGGLH